MLGQLQRIEFGVVVDSDGDRVADCQIGFDNHGPNPPSYRVWLKGLKTGSTVEKIGADFGPPLDWGFSEGVRANRLS